MQQQTIELSGLRLHYHHNTSLSRRAIFIHGYASSGRMWHSALEHLDGRVGGLAPDLPGHGLSDKPPFPWYSLDNFLAALRAFAQALQADPAVLVGHSMGGTFALEYACRYPRSVERLVLVNPVITGRLYVDLPWLARIVPGRWILSATRRLWPSIASGIQGRINRQRSRGRSGGYVQRNQEDLSRMTADSLLGCARAVAHADLMDRLESIGIPSLVVVGRRDATVPPREGRLAARRLPGAQLEELVAGHLPFDEAPDRFLSVLTSFLLEPSQPAR